MFCGECGAQIPDQSTLCPSCQSPIDDATVLANHVPNEDAPKFCGDCGRPMDMGQKTCSYCSNLTTKLGPQIEQGDLSTKFASSLSAPSPAIQRSQQSAPALPRLAQNSIPPVPPPSAGRKQTKKAKAPMGVMFTLAIIAILCLAGALVLFITLGLQVST